MLIFYILLFGHSTTSVHQILHKSQKSMTETLTMIRLAFGEESMSCTWKLKLNETEKEETDEKQCQE